MSFLKELKRRKVYHVGIAYVMAAWLLLQLTDVLASLLVLPEVVGKVVILVLVIGFPVALFLAWAFELTPEGIKRDGEVDGDRSIAPRSGKKLYSVILVMMGLIIAYLLYGRISGQLPDTVSNPATGIANQTAGNKVLTLGVAVLPFANLSSDTENKFFAAGVHEEVLADLSRIADLRVISRTSMLRIAETATQMSGLKPCGGIANGLSLSLPVCEAAGQSDLFYPVRPWRIWPASYHRRASAKYHYFAQPQSQPLQRG